MQFRLGGGMLGAFFQRSDALVRSHGISRREGIIIGIHSFHQVVYQQQDGNRKQLTPQQFCYGAEGNRFKIEIRREEKDKQDLATEDTESKEGKHFVYKIWANL